jgi:hypothetical protein
MTEDEQVEVVPEELSVEEFLALSETAPALWSDMSDCVNRTWLACAIDSEGSIYIRRSNNTMMPCVRLVNSNKQFIEKARAIIGSGCHFYTVEPSSTNTNTRTLFEIQVFSLKEVKKVLDLILPFLVVKKDRAELCLEFVNARLDGHYLPYTEREYLIYEEIKQLNHRVRKADPIPEREKVSDKELLDFLGNAKRTSAIAQHFSVSYSAMLARLKRLFEAKKVVKKYRGKEAFWISRSAIPA